MNRTRKKTGILIQRHRPHGAAARQHVVRGAQGDGGLGRPDAMLSRRIWRMIGVRSAYEHRDIVVPIGPCIAAGAGAEQDHPIERRPVKFSQGLVKTGQSGSVD